MMCFGCGFTDMQAESISIRNYLQSSSRKISAMYCSHFGFTIKPFQINTDPGFLWLGKQHKEALSVLQSGVMKSRSFLVLTGDVGTGKTTLLNALFENLPDNVLAARIPDPKLDLLDFIHFVAAAFGINESFASADDFIIHFERFLNEQYHLGKAVLLIVDEAQHLTNDLLEIIRRLSDMGEPGANPLHAFFIGQDEFNEKLTDDRNTSFRERITHTYHIEAIRKKDVGEYLRHRQRHAGAEKNFFTEKAIDRIYDFSGGLPRLINIICDRALLTAYIGGKDIVSAAIVSECARELEIRPPIRPPDHNLSPVPVPVPEKPLKANRAIINPNQRKKTVLALFLLLLGGYFAYQYIPASLGRFDAIMGERRVAPSGGDAKSSSLAAVKSAAPVKIVIHFLMDEYDPDPRSLGALDQAKLLLQLNPEMKATVVGYTDSTGAPQHKRHLSTLRAYTVESYLGSNGINPVRIDSKGLGIQNPAASNRTRAGRAMNNRVEILFHPPAAIEKQ